MPTSSGAYLIMTTCLIVLLFDEVAYTKFVEEDGENPHVVPDIREKYADACWGTDRETLLGDGRSFRGPHPGPTERGRRHKQGGGYFFHLFWSEETMAEMVRQTNIYAYKDVIEYTSPYTNGGPRWTPVTAKEFRCWLGVVILMGLKSTPTIRDYWKEDSFWRCPVISKVMTRDRFECILRCLHCVNNQEIVTDRNDPQYDKIAKVRWVFESFVEKSRQLYNPDKFCTADEIMIVLISRTLQPYPAVHARETDTLWNKSLGSCLQPETIYLQHALIPWTKWRD